MAAAAVSRLAASRVCDGTDAVSDVRPAARVEGAAGTFVGVEGRRVAGAAPGDRGAAAAEPQTEAGLGRPDGDRCPGAAAPETVADEPPGHAGHAAAMAPATTPGGHPYAACASRVVRNPADLSASEPEQAPTCDVPSAHL